MAKDKKDIREESFCACWFKEGRVFTLEEEAILKEIRDLRAKYNELKKRLDSLKRENPESPEIFELENQIATIREKRKDLENIRQEAAKERMKLLGHI